MTVQQFLDDRFSALAGGDYGAVYDSYCADAPFLQQFNDRNTYVDYARQQLGAIKIISWLSRGQRTIGDGQVEALLAMKIDTGETTQFYYELALLIETKGDWRYHSAQKLGVDDYSGTPQQINFNHFDDVAQKIRF